MAREDELGKNSRKTFDFIGDAAKNASASMKQAFENGLFDPFHDGLKGIVSGFIDAIRRMVAEVAANEVFASKSSGGLGLGDIISDGLGSVLKGFATGGSFTVGGSGGTDSQLVAFRATPGESVSINRPGQGGSQIVQHISIDARGSTVDSVKLLQAQVPAIIRQSVDLARAAVRDDISRYGRAYT